MKKDIGFKANGFVLTPQKTDDPFFVMEWIPENITQDEVFIFFHGFPSWRSKSYDLCEELALKGHIVYCPHQPCLGQSLNYAKTKPLKFSFLNALSAMQEFVHWVQERHANRKISFVGHSWGGQISVQLFDYATRIVLLGPLLILPDGEDLKKLAQELYHSSRIDFGLATLEEVVQEVEELKSRIDWKRLEQKMHNKNIVLIHGRQDEILPFSVSEKLAQLVPSIRFYSPDNDHALFVNRRDLVGKFIEMIK